MIKGKDSNYSGLTYNETTYYINMSVIKDGNSGVKVDNALVAEDEGDKIAGITNDFSTTIN
ncbi:MAG: hypothetical protein J6I76_16665 [Oribacterium sp.]|nr:hypothetical protein [Oribacterium sp.]MBP3805492.1 hypothetical protein [Oribacterium sp.]